MAAVRWHCAQILAIVYYFRRRCFWLPSVEALLILYFLILYLIAVTQREIEALYKRFRSLDRGRKASISLPSRVQFSNPAAAFLTMPLSASFLISSKFHHFNAGFYHC